VRKSVSEGLESPLSFNVSLCISVCLYLFTIDEEDNDD